MHRHLSSKGVRRSNFAQSLIRPHPSRPHSLAEFDLFDNNHTRRLLPALFNGCAGSDLTMHVVWLQKSPPPAAKLVFLGGEAELIAKAVPAEPRPTQILVGPNGPEPRTSLSEDRRPGPIRGKERPIEIRHPFGISICMIACGYTPSNA